MAHVTDAVVVSLPFRPWCEQDCDDADQTALEELARLHAAAVAYRCSEHASLAAESGRLSQSIASLDIAAANRNSSAATETWLLTSMDSWQSFAAEGAPRVAPMPPSPESVPARPILLDAAQDHVAYRSFAHRVEQRPEAKSTFSRLFTGWGC